MKYYTVDTSVWVAYFFQEDNITEEISSTLEEFNKGKCKFYVPELALLEFGNVLRTAVIRKRLGALPAKSLYETFMKLPLTLVSLEYDKVLGLALKNNLSVYDSAYLYVAQSTKTELLTLDKALVAACSS